MKKAKIGIIGLGQRGYFMLKDTILVLENVEVVALCDEYEDRIERAKELVAESYKGEIFTSTDYREVLKQELDAVYIATAWESHSEIAVAAMEAKIAVGLEVGGAYTLDECYAMVEAYEKTGTPFMFMENCCYGDKELVATNLARDGKFGEIVFCSGSYGHDLRDEISRGNLIRHYRLRNYTARNCENYPTHELGPIAMLLGINRGNRMVSLVSMASKAAGLSAYIEKHKLYEEDESLKGRVFNQGDIVTTLIKCENGELIKLTLDTSLPRVYNRQFNVRGTEGYYAMDTNTVYIDNSEDEFLSVGDFTKKYLDNELEFESEYLPKRWKAVTEEEKEKGHGGMDYIMFEEFVNAVIEKTPMPIDVYDAAAWMCVTALSEKSIANNGESQEVPDFTNGAYKTRKIKDVLEWK